MGSKTEYVVGFAFDTKDTTARVVLVQKARPEWQVGLWNGVGGHVEEKENHHSAMVREFAEETGVYVPHWDEFLRLEDLNQQWAVTFYRSFGVAVENCRTMTDEAVHAWPVQDLFWIPTIPNLRWLIPMATQPEVVTYMPDPHRRASGPIKLTDRSSSKEWQK